MEQGDLSMERDGERWREMEREREREGEGEGEIQNFDLQGALPESSFPVYLQGLSPRQTPPELSEPSRKQISKRLLRDS